jgi:hypothetical protein
LMGRRTFTAEQIIGKLREAEVLLSLAASVGEASKKVGVSDQTSYRRRREFDLVRPHSALGNRPPVPEAIRVVPAGAILCF